MSALRLLKSVQVAFAALFVQDEPPPSFPVPLAPRAAHKAGSFETECLSRVTTSVRHPDLPPSIVCALDLWSDPQRGRALELSRAHLLRCGVSQCTVPRSTVPFPMTSPYVGRGVIFFLLKLVFTHDSRTLPGFAPPGVSTTLLFGDELAVCDVRLRTGHAPATFRSIKAFIQLLLQSELSHLHPSSCVRSNRCSALVTQRFLNTPGILSSTSTTSLHNASRCGHSSNERGHS